MAIIIMMIKRTLREESFQRYRERERESEKKVTLAGESKHSGNQSHICPVENYVLI